MTTTTPKNETVETSENKALVTGDLFPDSAHKALLSMYSKELASRMKELEVQEQAVDASSPFIIRLDGVSFYTFTKGVTKPFDDRITRAMVKTAKDLLEKFNAVMAYTVSDEISLVFAAAHVIQSPPSNVEDDVESRPATEDQQVQESNSSSTTSTTTNPKKKRKVEKPKNHPYNGRIMKLATVAASYASARFNLHLTTETWTDLGNPVVESRMLEHTAHFDARVVPCASAQLVMECLFWRSNFDGLRNAISHATQSYYSPKQLHGKSILAQCDMLWKDKQINIFSTYPIPSLFGTWLKKEQYQLENPIHPITGKPIETPVVRTRVREGSFNWADWSEKDRITFTMSKFWPSRNDSMEGGVIPPMTGLAE